MRINPPQNRRASPPFPPAGRDALPPQATIVSVVMTRTARFSVEYMCVIEVSSELPVVTVAIFSTPLLAAGDQKAVLAVYTSY